MDKSVVVAMIGGFVSLVGVWLTHYLAIRRELLFRGLQGQSQAAPELKAPERASHLFVPVSRKTLLRDWRRALVAIGVCPLLDVVVTFVSADFLDWLFPKPGDLLSVTVWDLMRELVPAMAPWFYAISIAILLPLLVFFYGRLPRKPARLILSVLSWSVVSILYFWATVWLGSGDSTTPNTANDVLSMTAPATIGGCVSGLAYWLITYTRDPRVNLNQAL
jgi:hypothetical protein